MKRVAGRFSRITETHVSRAKSELVRWLHPGRIGPPPHPPAWTRAYTRNSPGSAFNAHSAANSRCKVIRNAACGRAKFPPPPLLFSLLLQVGFFASALFLRWIVTFSPNSSWWCFFFSFTSQPAIAQQLTYRTTQQSNEAARHNRKVACKRQRRNSRFYSAKLLPCNLYTLFWRWRWNKRTK